MIHKAISGCCGMDTIKNWFIKKCPNQLFPSIMNTYYTLLHKEVKIRKVKFGWLIQKDGIELLSPTPKFLGFGLKVFENKFERFFKIEKGDTCLDIGACIGDTTVPMVIKTGSQGKVIAVEPHPLNIKYLKFNLANFKNVEIIEKAITNERTKIPLYIHNTPTGHSIIPFEGCGIINVPADTLDNLFADRRIDFVKIDVQGAEVQVLKGGDNFLKNIRKLAVETHCRFDPNKRTYPKVINILKNYDYSIRFCMDNGVVYAWRDVR